MFLWVTNKKSVILKIIENTNYVWSKYVKKNISIEIGLVCFNLVCLNPDLLNKKIGVMTCHCRFWFSIVFEIKIYVFSTTLFIWNMKNHSLSHVLVLREKKNKTKVNSKI